MFQFLLFLLWSLSFSSLCLLMAYPGLPLGFIDVKGSTIDSRALRFPVLAFGWWNLLSKDYFNCITEVWLYCIFILLKIFRLFKTSSEFIVPTMVLLQTSLWMCILHQARIVLSYIRLTLRGMKQQHRKRKSLEARRKGFYQTQLANIIQTICSDF